MKKVRYKKLYIKLFHLHKISRKGKLVAAYGWGGGGGQGGQGLTANKPREVLGGDGYSPAVQWWWLHRSTNSLKVIELYTYPRGILWYIHYISAKLVFKIQYYVISRYACRRAALILKTIRLHWFLISTSYHWLMVSCYESWKHGHPRTCCPTELPEMRATVYSCVVPYMSQPPSASEGIWGDWGPQFEFTWHLSEVEWPCVAHGYPTAQLSSTSLSLFSPKPDEPEGVTYAQLNTAALSGAASVPAEETPNSCDYTMVKV